MTDYNIWDTFCDGKLILKREYRNHLYVYNLKGHAFFVRVRFPTMEGPHTFFETMTTVCHILRATKGLAGEYTLEAPPYTSKRPEIPPKP